MTVEQYSFDSEQEWLLSRKKYVTATEIGKLARGSKKVWQKLRAEKAGEQQAADISNLPAVIHGKTREPEIAEWVAKKAEPDTLVHNTSMFVRDGKYAATPDMISPDWVVVGEIKTISENRLASLKRWPTPDYYDQIQWQLFVTGAEFCHFAWEPYFSEDSDLVPWTVDRGVKIVTRDEQRIGELKAIADRFLDGYDSMEVEDEVHLLFSELRDICKQEAELKPLLARKAEIEDELRMLAGGSSKSWEAGDLRVTVSAPATSKRFDKKKLFSEHPDLKESDFTVESTSKARVRVSYGE
ncbi:YqaJ viral recombinase family protein [Corynebacterium kroppenstedtii]|uniref:YqaJ viral recombinase family protein n=1 Tax=Corynebacterium sp. PCR 32 TaxID=3351342 RepID=UPI0030A50DFD